MAGSFSFTHPMQEAEINVCLVFCHSFENFLSFIINYTLNPEFNNMLCDFGQGLCRSTALDVELCFLNSCFKDILYVLGYRVVA